MSETTVREQLASLAKDRRAWIPFAVIGVLLLLLSTVLIVSLETREDPEPEVDEQLAFDRGEASAQAALRDAVRDAATEAGDAPLTSLADDTDPALESALQEAHMDDHEEDSFGELDPDEQADHLFENYVRLLVYEHASERFDGAGQEIRETEVEISITDLDIDNGEELTDQLERVHLDIGHEDTNDLGPATLGVTLENVDMNAYRDGELVIQETEDITVSVGTTLFELHNRTQEYERLLNLGFFDGLSDAIEEGSLTGLGQEFGLRLYPTAYAKSGLKLKNPAYFDEIVPEGQTEFLANDAIYSVQEDAFGVTDPQSSREMQIGTLCFALDMAYEMAGDAAEEKLEETLSENLGEVFEDDETRDAISETLGDIDFENGIESVCNVVRDALGEEGDLEIGFDFDFTDMLGGLDQDDAVTDDTVDVPIDTSAALAYRMITEDDIIPEDEKDWTQWQGNLTLIELVPSEEGIKNHTSGEEVEVNASLDGIRQEVLKPFYSNLTGKYSHSISDSVNTTTIVDDVYSLVGQLEVEESTDSDEEADPEPPSDDDWNEIDNEEIDSSTEQSASVEKADLTDGEVSQVHMLYDHISVMANRSFTEETTWERCAEYDNGTCVSYDQETTTDTGYDMVEVVLTIEGTYAPGADLTNPVVNDPYGDGGVLEGEHEELLEELLDIEPDEGESYEEALKGEYEMPDEVRDLEEMDDEDENATRDSDDLLDDRESTVDELTVHLNETVFGESPVTEVNRTGENRTEAYEGGLLNASTDPTVEPVEVNQSDYLEDDDERYMDGLLDNIDDEREKILTHDDDTYDNISALADNEMLQQYIYKLEKGVDTTESVRKNRAYSGPWERFKDGLFGWGSETVVEGLERLFGPMLDFGEIALDILNDEDHSEEPGDIESDIFENIQFEIHGSPTYLTMDADNRSDTAAVREGGDGRFAGMDPGDMELQDGPDSITGTDYATMHSAYANPIPYPGVPIIPIKHLLQVSAWNAEVGGEYPRFEVSATDGDPATTTSYVRENKTIRLEINGDTKTVGEVNAISFTGRTALVILMPPLGGVGDGNHEAWKDPTELIGLFGGCSDTYPELGPGYEEADELEDRLSSDIEDFNDDFPVLDPIPTPEDLEEIDDDAFGEITEMADDAGCIADQVSELVDAVIDDDD